MEYVARCMHIINDALEDRQIEYLSTMVELEGKICNHAILVLIDSGSSLSYMSQKLVELF